jgi:ectoine hydroxylase-related dioxygenase (phytanoyl-CoA dioxygenase family)|tara:strand:- start:226 stop:882 length:657 start_codon:yes stop_codon:yes gene_type:complete
MEKVTYNINDFPFKEKLQNIFNTNDLTTLNEDVQVLTREKDQSTKYHKLFYRWIRNPDIINLYDKFINEIVRPLYNEQIVYQAIPTFRIMYSNNVAVGEFHKDKHYRDEKWAAKVKEDNFYFPFTDAFETNTIWVESEEDKGDFEPINCKYGELVRWDGSNLTHGNKINKTGRTRISMDFRVIKYSNYQPSDYGSVNTETKFKIGGYYKIIDNDKSRV